MEKNESKGILSLIPEAIGMVKAVGKNHKNQLQNYQFRSIDDFMAEISSVLSTLKITIAPNYTVIASDVVAAANGKTYKSVLLKGDYIISAPDGSFITASTIGEAYDYSDKACNKAMSTAFKYMIMQVFCIPTEEKKDTEYESIETNKSVKPINPVVANFHKATGTPIPSKVPELKKELSELYPKKEIPPEGITYVEKLLKNNNATEKELITAIDHCKKYENKKPLTPRKPGYLYRSDCKKYESKKPLTPEIEAEYNEAFGDNIKVDEDDEPEGLL